MQHTPLSPYSVDVGEPVSFYFGDSDGSLNPGFMAMKVDNHLLSLAVNPEIMSEVRIRCPKCNWEPKAHDKWQCSCGNQWNTFSTAGRCPKCAKIWKDTQCFHPPTGCSQWSPHLDWYDGLDEIVKKLIEEIETSWTLAEEEEKRRVAIPSR